MELIRQVVVFDAPESLPEDVTTWAEFIAEGGNRAAQSTEAEFRAQALQATADDVATVLYTSGTTGDSYEACAQAFIEVAEVSCTGPTTVEFRVETTGEVPSDGLIFSQETANATPQYSDEHTLAVVTVCNTGHGAIGLSI